MNGIWVIYKNKDTEFVTLCTRFDIVRVSGIRELHFLGSDIDDECYYAATENSHDIDAIMSDIKRAIKNGDRLVEIDLEKYELS